MLQWRRHSYPLTLFASHTSCISSRPPGRQSEPSPQSPRGSQLTQPRRRPNPARQNPEEAPSLLHIKGSGGPKMVASPHPIIYKHMYAYIYIYTSTLPLEALRAGCNVFVQLSSECRWADGCWSRSANANRPTTWRHKTAWYSHVMPSTVRTEYACALHLIWKYPAVYLYTAHGADDAMHCMITWAISCPRQYPAFGAISCSRSLACSWSSDNILSNGHWLQELLVIAFEMDPILTFLI